VPVRVGGPAQLAAAYAVLGGAGWLAVWAIRRVRGDATLGPGADHRPAAVNSTLGLSAGRLRAVVAAALMLTAAGAVAASATRPDRPHVRAGELVVSFLDIGQGDATLLQTRDAAVLFDTGPPGGPILRRLREAGVGRLDLLVLTHAEADHEGMALPIIARHRPRLVLDGGAGWPSPVQPQLAAAVRAAAGRLLTPRAGQRIRLGPLSIEILWPPPPPPGWRPEGTPNDRAVVARVRDGAFDMLLPADAESNVTTALDLSQVDALKVAHHGSADEGLPRLLERLRPAIAAIEVGARNTYGHPTPSTLGALRAVPQVIRTDVDGTVRLHVTASGIRLERHAG
jgi:competence protein ComEC